MLTTTTVESSPCCVTNFRTESKVERGTKRLQFTTIECAHKSYTVVDECSESIQKVVKRIDYDEEVKTLCTSESRRLANAFREISSIVDPHNLRRRKKSFASSIVKSASPHPSSPTTYSEGQKQQQYNKEVEAEIEKHLSTTVKEQIGPSVHDQLPNTKSFLQV